MPVKEVLTSCRICAGVCALRLTVNDNDRIVAVRGDKDNPVTRGFACIKGLHAHEAHYSPERILHPQKRQPDGSFVRIELETALDEIAERLRRIADEHGPEAIAGFRGTANYQNLAANHMLPDWLASLGSNSFYSTMTIDQSAKWVSFERLGMWAAGLEAFDSVDVLMMVGTNPLVSLGTFNYPMQDPVKQMHEARARGVKLVVIDPRRTETARHADVLLQPLPGEDVTVVAGLLNVIFRNSWQDKEFCTRYVNGLDALMLAVAPYTPEYVARRADVRITDLLAAAELFAAPLRDGDSMRRKRGSAASGTATNMGPHSNLAEHLVQCLNVVCGRFARVGETVGNPGVVGPRMPRMAMVIPPQRSWETGWRSRIDGLGMLYGQKMSGILAEEILTPGPGRLRAMFVVAGNPINAIPDPKKQVAAFRNLDLLVSIDPFMNNTARLAHYIIAPKMMFERADLPSRDLEPFITLRPYAQYTAPAIPVPAGSEVVDDWYVFWALAKRLGKTVVFDGVALDMEHEPTTDELLGIIARNGVVPYEEIKRHPGGKLFNAEPMEVLPPPEGDIGRFEVMPPEIGPELAAVLGENATHPDYPFRLAVRRLREVHNTWMRNIPAIRRAMPHNAAYLNPDDLADLGIVTGSRISLKSADGSIEVIAEADDSLRRGIVSISHGWGGLPDEPADPARGVNVNLLLNTERRESINGMPVMTGVPLNVEALA